MKATIQQVGYLLGDKHLEGDIPNLKCGEVRYYPQDNPNLIRTKRWRITRKVFLRLLKRSFQNYRVDDDLSTLTSEEKRFYIGAIYHKDSPIPIVKNKGYICFKEATSESDGWVFNLHDGFIYAYRERYTLNQG